MSIFLREESKTNFNNVKLMEIDSFSEVEKAASFIDEISCGKNSLLKLDGKYYYKIDIPDEVFQKKESLIVEFFLDVIKDPIKISRILEKSQVIINQNAAHVIMSL